MKQRTVWLIVGLGAIASLVLSLWLKSMILFLFLPFLGVPFFFAKPNICPECGHETMHPAMRYCPIDGAKLERK